MNWNEFRRAMVWLVILSGDTALFLDHHGWLAVWLTVCAVLVL